jgi:hypothetical protein
VASHGREKLQLECRDALILTVMLEYSNHCSVKVNYMRLPAAGGNPPYDPRPGPVLNILKMKDDIKYTHSSYRMSDRDDA